MSGVRCSRDVRWVYIVMMPRTAISCRQKPHLGDWVRGHAEAPPRPHRGSSCALSPSIFEERGRRARENESQLTRWIAWIVGIIRFCCNHMRHVDLLCFHSRAHIFCVPTLLITVVRSIPDCRVIVSENSHPRNTNRPSLSLSHTHTHTLRHLDVRW